MLSNPQVIYIEHGRDHLLEEVVKMKQEVEKLADQDDLDPDEIEQLERLERWVLVAETLLTRR